MLLNSVLFAKVFSTLSKRWLTKELKFEYECFLMTDSCDMNMKMYVTLTFNFGERGGA